MNTFAIRIRGFVVVFPGEAIAGISDKLTPDATGNAGFFASPTRRRDDVRAF
ncbi:hypothetical protein [Novosphingobium sp. AP12]|uniref:hypothetical protein n=1 Tax=Novosphingobium sp. AP12 TaxID=1144305 RepID=UPI00138AD4D1|nr:hypothetical protein [Novosphingobium sp. AP12]